METGPESVQPPPLPEMETAIPVARLAAEAHGRFCRGCGAEWQAEWSECPRCAAQMNRPETALVAEAAAGYSADMRWVKSAMTLYFALLGVSIVTIIVVLASGGKVSVAGELAEGVVFAGITAGWCAMSARMLWPVLAARFNPGWLAAALGAAGVTYLLASGAVYFITGVMGGEHLRYLENFTKEGYGFGWAVLSVCVQPAIFEELAFRGVIQTSLMRVLGKYEALFATAVMFGILHLSALSLPHLLVLGVALGWLRLRTGSLFPGMVLHFTHNFLTIWSERHGSYWLW